MATEQLPEFPALRALRRDYIGLPAHCQFPACVRLVETVVTYWDLASGDRRRTALCRQHVEHCHVLVPVERVEAVGVEAHGG